MKNYIPVALRDQGTRFAMSVRTFLPQARVLRLTDAAEIERLYKAWCKELRRIGQLWEIDVDALTRPERIDYVLKRVTETRNFVGLNRRKIVQKELGDTIRP